ncbi:MAG: PLP-dependent aminotransferase family protein [Isosphaeraceae bacterium]|nr:PLP-dependent aminotransferase family protein [Isosphaeraceae bacterium]
MTPSPQLSEAAVRTSPAAISSMMQMALANPGLISLAAGFVDQGSLPAEAARRAMEAVLADPVEGRRALQYGTTIGDLGLRTRLIEQLERNERVPAGSFRGAVGRTVVTTGSQQLLYLITEALLDPGDIVLVEAPTYFVFLGVLETRGARAIGVETDEGGLRLDALEATLRDLKARGLLSRVKLLYTISEHSNPTGVSLAEERRGPLVELIKRWSGEQKILILEDAAYRGLTYSGAEPPSVWRHDPAGDTVILARTFSKTFSPGLKTGYGILPETLLEPVLRLKGNHDFGSGHFAQQVLERILVDGTYERHVQELIAVYRRKRDVMLGALEEHLGAWDGAVSWTCPKGGLFLWLSVPEGLDTGPEGPLFARCLEEGVIYVPGALAYAAEPGPFPRNHARICFGVPSEEELNEGARRLAAALAECFDAVA